MPFRAKWSSFSWEESTTPHQLFTNPLGTVGTIGVFKRENSMSPLLAKVLEFLSWLVGRGKAYMTLNVSRSIDRRR